MAILAGIFTALEAAINSQLGKVVTPRIATLHSLIVGFLVFLIANLLSGSISQYRSVLDVKPQLLIGGIFGAFIIYLVTRTIPSIGITATITLVISAEILCSFYIDTFVFHHQAIDFRKIAGAMLVIAGVYFILD
jgi:transporter family-2 protein